MGQFSWKDCVDNSVIYCDERAKTYVLVPKQFGGGHIVENCYGGYGVFGGKDIYDLVAIWNRYHIAMNPYTYDKHSDKFYKDYSWYESFANLSLSVEDALKEWEKEVGRNVELRTIGIEIACYNDQNFKLPFPIKITHSHSREYEECCPSYTDPNQGWR